MGAGYGDVLVVAGKKARGMGSTCASEVSIPQSIIASWYCRFRIIAATSAIIATCVRGGGEREMAAYGQREASRIR